MFRAMLLGFALFALPISQRPQVTKLVLLVNLRDPLNQNFDIRIPVRVGERFYATAKNGAVKNAFSGLVQAQTAGTYALSLTVSEWESEQNHVRGTTNFKLQLNKPQSAGLIFSLLYARTVTLWQGTTSEPCCGSVKKIQGLNSTQQKAVEAYIQQNERPTGELIIVADRDRIALRSSKALQLLFPKYRFVTVPWVYRGSGSALRKYSIPGTLVHTLVLDNEGRNCMPESSSDKGYGELLRAERIKVTDSSSAALVAAAFTDIYGVGLGPENRRHGNSEWFLGYREFPFRHISSYEEVREASYYLVSVDATGTVMDGRLVNDVLERRKIK
ncbi:MAG TPA: hypothetical protein VKP13_14270 [Nitrospira sp.]|nr:hypothetical protein [Nitrospira sp.]